MNVTKLISYSIRLHLAVFCCFLLPFFQVGCKKETPAETTITDSVAVESPVEKIDTSYKIETSSNQSSLDSSAKDKEPEPIPEEERLSDIISQKAPFLSPILTPKASTYSGIAAVIDLIPFYSFYSIIIVFILLILSITLKFMDSNSWKAIVLMEVIAGVSLYFYNMVGWNPIKQWGYWVAITFLILLTIFDMIILRHKIKENSQ